MRLTSFFILFFVSFAVTGQNKVALKLVPSKSDETYVCYNLEMSYEGEEVTLGSQNYRIFYSSESLSFIEEVSKTTLRPDHYTFNVVQHNQGIDASEIGKIEFEQSLGFINASIILNDPRLSGQKLKRENGWTSTLELCFEEKNKEVPKQIILARKSLTADYGRAFIELSFIDQNGAISSLPVYEYSDLKE